MTFFVFRQWLLPTPAQQGRWELIANFADKEKLQLYLKTKEHMQQEARFRVIQAASLADAWNRFEPRHMVA